MNNNQLKFQFKDINNQKYKIDGIQNKKVYVIELVARQLLELYYLVL